MSYRCIEWSDNFPKVLKILVTKWIFSFHVINVFALHLTHEMKGSIERTKAIKIYHSNQICEEKRRISERKEKMKITTKIWGSVYRLTLYDPLGSAFGHSSGELSQCRNICFTRLSRMRPLLINGDFTAGLASVFVEKTFMKLSSTSSSKKQKKDFSKFRPWTRIKRIDYSRSFWIIYVVPAIGQIRQQKLTRLLDWDGLGWGPQRVGLSKDGWCERPVSSVRVNNFRTKWIAIAPCNLLTWRVIPVALIYQHSNSLRLK